jgi:hypothetical protein
MLKFREMLRRFFQSLKRYMEQLQDSEYYQAALNRYAHS